MPPTYHDAAEDKLAKCMPCTAEAVCSIWNSNTDADGTVGADGFEDDVEDTESLGVSFELTPFDDHDEKYCKDNCPGIMGKLRAKLLMHKVPGTLLQVRRAGESRLEPRDTTPEIVLSTSLLLKLSFVVAWPVSIDAQATFLIYVAVPHSDDNRIDRDIHHDHVKHLQ